METVGLKSELAKVLIGSVLILTFFLFSNFDPIVAAATFGMIVLYIVWGRKIPIVKGGQTLVKILLVTALAFAGWIIIASVLDSLLYGSAFSPFSLFERIATYTTLPTLTQNQNLQLLVYGVDIPIAESLLSLSFILLFWSRLFRFVPRWNPMDPKMWFVISLVGMVMAVFHFTVRRFSEVGLVTDFAFFAFSAAVVMFRGQLAEGILIHVLNNSMVVYFGDF